MVKRILKDYTGVQMGVKGFSSSSTKKKNNNIKEGKSRNQNKRASLGTDESCVTF